MDRSKSGTLKNELSKLSEPQVVEIRRFFDGNEDEGSIGCNLVPHPGIDAFRSALTGLSERPGVRGVYAAIAELDPGEDSWPFTDTVVIVGDVSSDEVSEVLAHLQPDDVSSAEVGSLGLPGLNGYLGQSVVVWWD